MAFYRKLLSGRTPKDTADPSSSPKKKRGWKRVLLRLLSITGVCFAVGVFAFTLFAAWVSRDLPDPDNLLTRDVPQSTKIFDRTGKVLLFEIHGDEKRTLVKIEEIPDFMKDATVAIEDKLFYEHHGVYWKGLVRAVFLNPLQGKPLGSGASTLTQQFVKNALLTNERSPMRKLRELILTLQIERRYTKEQILQMYLNEIPYGSNLYGVESASQAYFGKPAKELTLDEAALLAAIPQRPDCYSPYGTGRCGDGKEKVVTRQHYILDLMVEQGHLPKEQAEEAKKIETLKKVRPRRLGDIEAPHFVMYVQSLLEETYGLKRLEQGGLKVTTTLDWEKQQAADAAVKAGVEARGKTYGFGNAALISLDPKNGQVLAMVGSKDYYNKEIKGEVNVTIRPRQPGSSFKPIVYAAGFARGYLPETKLWDVFTSFRTDSGRYEPRNYDLKERGPVTVRQALQWSLNIPAVQMLYLVGIGRTIDFAESLGYTTLTDRSRFGLALVLGGAEVKPIEHASAFAAFANDGTRYPTSAILKVEDPNGVVLEEWKQPEGIKVMDPQIARLTSNVLSDNDTRAAIFGLRNSLTLPDRPVAAKTGTTNEFKDAWTVGYTPNLVAVVWVGNSSGTNMKRGADGSVIAAPIWQAYMRKATEKMPIESFLPPTPPTTSKLALLGKAFETQIKVDKISGKRATEFTPAEFIEERTYFEPHSILYYIDKDDPAGPAPTNPTNDPQFATWESAVSAWVQKNNWNTTTTPPLDYDDVHTIENMPIVAVLQPFTNQTIDSRSFTVSANASASRPIERLEVLINNTPIGSSLSQPWHIPVHIPNSFEKGFYELTVRAIDSAGNRGQTSITINVTAEPDMAKGVTIQTPAYNATWQKSTFPKSVELLVLNPDQYQKIEISFLGTDGVRRLVASESALAPLTRIPLSIGPAPGHYQLIATAIMKDTGEKEEASVMVQITE
jgi:penicillin-binding protein 1C